MHIKTKLASTAEPELGAAQPQLAFQYFLFLHRLIPQDFPDLTIAFCGWTQFFSLLIFSLIGLGLLSKNILNFLRSEVKTCQPSLLDCVIYSIFNDQLFKIYSFATNLFSSMQLKLVGYNIKYHTTNTTSLHHFCFITFVQCKVNWESNLI